jgi:ATP-dependent protease ClpP protease subunit
MARKKTGLTRTGPTPQSSKRNARPKPRAEFSANPNRAISINGSIGQDLVYKLTPDIIRLRNDGTDPITVYIDSPGGIVTHATNILNLLRAPSQYSTEPAHIITVATTFAASAAAILLASGDYAVAYPNSSIHFHGVRTYREDPITVEKASDVAKNLKASNSQSALLLAKNCAKRFFFRFVSMAGEIADYKKLYPKVTEDKDCFIELISARLSGLGSQVLSKAMTRHQRYQSLSAHVFADDTVTTLINKIGEDPSQTSNLYAQLEAEILRAIIKFEIDSNSANKGWNFSSQGLAQLNDDFFLLNVYIGHHKNDWIEEFCEQFKDFLLTDEQRGEINNLPESSRKAARVNILRPILLPVWLCLGAICQVLQEEENPLTPLDAFWLGLIDEVIGIDLPTQRKLIEQAPLREIAAPKAEKALPPKS